MQLILRKPVSQAATYATNFSLTENPLSEGGVWRQGLTHGLQWTNVRSSGGIAFGTQNGAGSFDDSVACLSGFAANHEAQGVVDISSNGATFQEIEILLRWSISANSIRGYECNVANDGHYLTFTRWNGPLNSFLELTRTSVAQPVSGDILKARVVGTVLTAFWNGVLVLTYDTVNDSTKFSDGNPGVGFFRSGGVATDYGFTSYSATDV